jgi:ATPase family associated with various cellular activities (AAA)
MSDGIPLSLRRLMGLPARTSSRGRRRRRKNTRVLKAWTYDAYEMNKDKMEQSGKDLFLGASDVSDYITSEIIIARNEQHLSTMHKEATILATRSEWGGFLMSSNGRIVQLSSDSGYLINDSKLSYLHYNIQAASIVLRMVGDSDIVVKWYDNATDQFEEVTNTIEWMYSSDGNSIEVPIRNDRKPIDEMYPFLDGRTLEDYYTSFLESSASILLLIGPPGTGKTTFIRGLLQHADTSAIVTYDASILAKDYIFAQFIEGDKNIMVIEDADNFLGARSDGNDMMHKFLNVGDGLVTTKGKKLIFSTNLPSIKDVDPALIRPGRCFDIVHFGQMNEEQATKLADKLGLELKTKDDGKYSVADIFHKQVEAPRAPKRSLGFV